MDKGIIYITDNSLAPEIASLCQRRLVEAAGSLPIVSVSQEPIELGTNICVGKIGRSWDSLYKQVMAGIDSLDTKYVALVEHDCLYTPEHFAWVPPADDVFFYNSNCWLVQWGGSVPELTGMYSYWPRRLAFSQLICNRGLLRVCIEERIELLGGGKSIRKQWLGCGEPGVVSERALKKARAAALSGRPIKLDQYLDQYLRKYQSAAFKTELPNLDIRHGTNFTGPKRGKKRRYELPYWGRFEDVARG